LRIAGQVAAAAGLVTFSLPAMATKKTSTASKKDPCWKGYEQDGTKKKDGKTVPNCVKKD
jgi:hypothetical protein